MELNRGWLCMLCLCGIGQVLADYLDEACNDDDKVFSQNYVNGDSYEENYLFNISLSRRYYNLSEKEEYKKYNLLVRKTKGERSSPTSNADSSEIKECNPTEFDNLLIQTTKLEVSDDTSEVFSCEEDNQNKYNISMNKRLF
jgi:hypothetical protein